MHSFSGKIVKNVDVGRFTPYNLPMKGERSDDQRTDSGVTSGSSECPSPSSNRSSSPTYQFQKSREYSNWLPPYPTQENVQSPDSTRENEQSPYSTSEDRTSPSYSTAMSSTVPTNTNGIDSIKQPQLNSHGKLKSYCCKRCGVKSYTKEDHWTHIRIHIDKNKLLLCETCPFATHLKHHFEFHVLSYHSGSKPFKCKLCDYACVNKSMLNSHLKSHSNNYPYRCGDCPYATKYLHTLKMHLQKTKHTQGVVLNADGTPNPYPIDVYGTRRGPKQKKTNAKLPIQTPKTQHAVLTNLALHSQVMPQFGALLGQGPLGPTFSPQEFYHTQEMLMAQNIMLKLFNQHVAQNAQADFQQPNSNKYDDGEMGPDGVLDLSSSRSSKSSQGDDDDEEMSMAFSNVEVVDTSVSEVKTESEVMPELMPELKELVFTCHHCNIDFKGKPGEFIYRIHMGHHGFNNPFTCNMCGENCENVVGFSMHISKAAH
ncbi:protein hunchback [Dendroctonus ponderosae]|uniref:protein hunchback n=1 Tax=Dendroctonus ponderosae TaxID=77166 RepID=UPI002034B94B|nr:protein hunchback [Dendroctonus ponderosae]KAH1004600.1 hypothetical protein HUJ05_005393 [Dendroctonus ponderosae]